MQVHGYGEIIWCREVIFENGKYDRLGRHPGIVIIPTSENEESAYCLHMTSDQQRTNRNKSKYVECKAAVKRGTYINIEHIIKRNNSMDSALIDEMSNNEFLELLRKFYEYQMNQDIQEKEFLDIRYKVEVLIELLKINKKLNLESRRIKYDELDKYSTIKDIKRINRIYSIELLLIYNELKDEINKKCFSEDRERIYAERLLELHRTLREVDYSKVDLDNPNNQIREIYIKSIQNNYLLNTNALFYDVIELFRVTEENPSYSIFIEKFIRHEGARQQKQRRKKEEKNKLRVEAKKKATRENSKAKLEKKREALIEKYGEFDWF